MHSFLNFLESSSNCRSIALLRLLPPGPLSAPPAGASAKAAPSPCAKELPLAVGGGEVSEGRDAGGAEGGSVRVGWAVVVCLVDGEGSLAGEDVQAPMVDKRWMRGAGSKELQIVSMFHLNGWVCGYPD